AADALPAVVIERDRLLALLDEALVEQVEHFEEGTVRADVHLVVDHPPGRAGVLLPPNVKVDVDRRLAHALSPVRVSHLYDRTLGCTSSYTSGSAWSVGGVPTPPCSHAATYM